MPKGDTVKETKIRDRELHLILFLEALKRAALGSAVRDEKRVKRAGARIPNYKNKDCGQRENATKPV